MIISQFLLHYCYIYVEKSIYLAQIKKQFSLHIIFLETYKRVI